MPSNQKAPVQVQRWRRRRGHAGSQREQLTVRHAKTTAVKGAFHLFCFVSHLFLDPAEAGRFQSRSGSGVESTSFLEARPTDRRDWSRVIGSIGLI